MPFESHIERSNKPRSGVALGGLGTGWFELHHDGIFRKWNIFNNRPVAGGVPSTLPDASMLFFVVRWVGPDGEPCMRLLQVEESHGSAGIEDHEFQYIFPWIDGVDRIDSSATVPFTVLTFRDQTMPFVVEMRAWSPLIPRNLKDSSLPVAFFDFTIHSLTDESRDVSILGSVRNGVGHDVKEKVWTGKRISAAAFQGVEMGADGMPEGHPSAGTMALISLDPSAACYIGWGHVHPYYEELLIHGLRDANLVDSRNGRDVDGGDLYAKYPCYSSVASARPSGETSSSWSASFALAWDFPNRRALAIADDDFAPPGYLEEQDAVQAEVHREPPHMEGHFYSNFFASAHEVVDYAARHHERLRQESENFHEAFYSSSLPEFLLDQVNSHLNTLRTSTWFTRAGDFGIGEGLGLTRSFAGLSTIDVAMYGQILTTALFPTLDKEVMRSHARIQLESGIIAHSVSHNFRETKPAELSGVRLDLTSQFVVLSLRAAWFSADNGFLREIWPSVKSALDYSIRERDHNGDGLPDMEGIMCSYDNFPMYGVAPYVAIQWLAAVQAACFAAKELGDSIFLDRYERIFERGLEGLEAATWNGSYYRLYADGPKSDEGCLTDQVFGHLSTHLSGLPEFLNPDRVNGALSSILKNNFRPKQGLRNCQWPDDGFLHEVDADCWVDQANTCWTGVELAFASHLIYRGRWDEALEIVACVDRRYRHSGMYWDHQEFGGHYFRPMSAWGILHAALGYSNKSGVLRFDVKVPEPQGRIFFSTADGYGHFEWSESHRSITVLDGVIRASDVLIKSDPHLLWKAEDGAILDQSEDGFSRLSPDALKQLSAGKSMRIEASLSNHSAEMRAT